MGTIRGNRDFTVLWLAWTSTELGTAVGTFAFPLLAVALTGSPVLAGLVGAAHLLGEVAALLPAGLLADHVDRRLLLRAACAADVALFAALGAAGLAGSLGLAQLTVTALLTGAAAGMVVPAEMAALRSVVAREDLPAALSANQARVHVAVLVGAPLGALLHGVARWLPFAFDALASAVAWVLLGRLRTDLAAPPRTERRPLLADVREGLRFVWSMPLVRTVAVWAALTNLAMNALFTVAVLRMVTGGVPPLHVGLVDAAAGACGIAGAVLAPRLIARVPTGWLTIAVAWSPLPLVVPMALWAHPAVVAAALGAVLLLNPAGNAGMTAYRLTLTPPELVGRVQAATRLVALLPLPLAPLLAGGLLSGFGGPAALLGTGLVCGAVALVPTLSRHVRAVPRPERWPAPLAASRRMEACPRETACSSSPAPSTAA